MRRREIWSSKHKFMVPKAPQLIIIWALYLIVELAGLSEAKPSSDFLRKNVCRTDACKQRAKLILDSMNATEDPCTDFYSYVCGNWKNSHQIPDDSTMIGNFDILAEKVVEDVKNILLNATITEDEPQNATDKAIRAYRVCVCETVDEEKKLQDLLQFLKEGGFTKWPILKDEATPYKNYTELLNKTGFSSLIAFQVYQDAKRIEEYVIYLDQTAFSWLGRNQLIYQTAEANKKIVEAYKELIKESVKLFRNDTKDKEKETQKVSEDILQFEAKLAMLSESGVGRRNFSLLYNEANISILSKVYPTIEWLQLLNNAFSYANITLDTNERVIVMEPNYIHGIEQILKNTSLSTLYNYVYWTQIRTYGSAASKKFEQLVFDFKKEAFGVKNGHSALEEVRLNNIRRNESCSRSSLCGQNV
uniref:Putative integral to membrane n=1 Tax=Ixodes ricinus TaxID=34613 RepID=A0A0K8RMA5_IXORI